jgi:hypothetical protein
MTEGFGHGFPGQIIGGGSKPTRNDHNVRSFSGDSKRCNVVGQVVTHGGVVPDAYS